MNILLVVRWPVGGIRTYLRYIYSQQMFRDISICLIAPETNDLKGYPESVDSITGKYIRPNSLTDITVF